MKRLLSALLLFWGIGAFAQAPVEGVQRNLLQNKTSLQEIK